MDTSSAIALPGYRITEPIYSGTRTLVYRGIRESNQVPVAIKLLQSEYPTFNELVQFRNQYTIAKNLNLPGIIKTYSLENYHNGYALVMEDFGGISLKEEWGNEGVGQKISHTLIDFFHIAIQIVSTLEGLYRNRVIHKDIKPANILINPNTKQVKLIDFSIASLLPKETQVLSNPNILEGTLPYLSPEQTGRMNRGIDYRSDFYSLGVTFFELLTGQLPFTTTDPMELVHCHIAKRPPSARNLNPNIPPVLSEIISKLMAKNAEDRYRSALGLKHDLETCLTQWKDTGKIDDFELGSRDISDRFIIPEKLYGREAEVATLLQAFERVAGNSQSQIENRKSKIELMLVAGFSGIGKTAVVNEVHKPIVRQRGYFIKGKFDQFQRDIPFSAFVQAFRDLMGQLLTETDIQLEAWKAKILAALGENGQVIIDVIPELERIIGKQPPVAELSGSAAQNRFNLLLQKFIQIFTTKEHPLVVFLDDLQWADSASLKLMQLLMSKTESDYLLLIGAYRDNEVNPAHPLILTLEEIKKAEATVNLITLDPLKPSDLNHLIAETLACPAKLALPLTKLVHHKTQGNPFFANQFLKALHEDGLISFNFKVGYWQCDIAQVRRLALTDDVVEFMALQLQKLPESTQAVLKLAACIGNQFDLETLAIVYEKSPAETAADLWKALQDGLVLPQSKTYKFFQEESVFSSQPCVASVQEQLTVPYKFLHDRVQQAAYFLIPENQKQATHLKIGQLLLNNTAEVEREEKIFEIVNQLNIGVQLITEQTERDELAQLNLIAGRKAKASTAYLAAVGYLTIGLKLLAADSWVCQYKFTLDLYRNAAEAAYLNGDFEQMARLVEIVLKQASTLLDRVKIYEIQIQACIAQNKLLEAVNTALKVLQLLGEEFPEKPSQLDIGRQLGETISTLSKQRIEDLIALPEMTDYEKLAAMRILLRVTAAAFIANPVLYPLMVFKLVNLSLTYGNAPSSSIAYANYGIILCGVVGDIESGYQFGQLALRLVDKFNPKDIKAQVLCLVDAFTLHWKQPARGLLKSFQETYKTGLETGDLEHAAWAAGFHSSYVAYFVGKELVELEREMVAYSTQIAQFKQKTALNYNALFRQSVHNLLGRSLDPCCLSGESCDEKILFPLYQQANDLLGINLLFLNKTILCYLFGKYDQAVENAAVVEKYLNAATAMLVIPVFHFYDSLAQLAVYPETGDRVQKRLLSKVIENQEKMKNWAHHAPMNHLHKFYLVEAERYRVLGQQTEAMDYYDRAIASAKEHQYINEEALSNELAAKFYLEWGKEKIAQVYLTDAYYAYARWGAKAKVEDLEKRYPELLIHILQREKTRFVSSETISVSNSTPVSNQTTISSETSILETLDLATVIKASQALSSEIQLDKLLSTLMQVAIANAGAQKCALIMLEGNNLVLEAYAVIGEAKTETQSAILQSVPVESIREIPLTILNYVKRTGKTLVMDDATVNTPFAADAYIIHQQPKSILCIPVMNQGKLMGLLYLENNLTVGAFTSDRVEILNLLCSQVAISLENAKLYQNLQQSEAREREKANQLEQSFQQLQQAQLQLVQSEKMSALGNLVAGVAHEINNPVGFIDGNLSHTSGYIQDLLNHLHLYQQHYPTPVDEIVENAEDIDLEFLAEDLLKMITSMKVGTERIRNISTSLRTFSRSDTSEKVLFNIHDGIDSTILILRHRLKANEQRPEIKVTKEYGNLPKVKCFPGQLNQVFMNLLANAIDALDEANQGRSFAEIEANPNQIAICTEVSQAQNAVVIRIKDNGLGMSEAVRVRIFDHLFTTKAVGKGTGLGLSISRQIVEETHSGQLSCISAPGEGTEFAIEIPM